PQDRHLPTSLVRRPLAEHVTLGLAAHEAEDVRGAAPGFAPRVSGRRAGTSRRSDGASAAVAHRHAPPGDDSLEPGAVERRSKARRIAQGGGPRRPRLLGLSPNGEGAGLQARRDERLEARDARVANPTLPALERVDVDA